MNNLMNDIYRLKQILRSLTMLTACATLFAACTADDSTPQPDSTDDPVEVTLSVATRAEVKATSTFDPTPEFTVETLRIYAFKGDELVGYHYASGTAITSPATGATLPAKVYEFKMTAPSDEVTFYAIANEGATGGLSTNNDGTAYTLPGSTTTGTATDEVLKTMTITPTNLTDLTFAKLPEPEVVTNTNSEGKYDEDLITYEGAILPMTAQHTATLSANASVTLTLKRSVAKLNLWFAKLGVPGDVLYMGRGLYLYNQPKYGYLFPKQYDGDTNTYLYRESDTSADTDTDSQLHQKGGRVILRSGWPEEPADPESGSDIETELQKTHINEIKVFNNTPSEDDLALHQHMPARPIYLFANHNVVTATNYVLAGKPTDTELGYHLKIMTHQHMDGETGNEGHHGLVHRIALPAVTANQNINIYAVIPVDGYASIIPHWKIAEWETGGGNITFE